MNKLILSVVIASVLVGCSKSDERQLGYNSEAGLNSNQPVMVQVVSRSNGLVGETVIIETETRVVFRFYDPHMKAACYTTFWKYARQYQTTPSISCVPVDRIN